AIVPHGTEVVFSDWGVLHLLRREFPRLVPVQGRLLNKSLRDPRVMGMYAETQAANGAALATLGALQRSSLDCASYTGLLERLGPGRGGHPAARHRLRFTAAAGCLSAVRLHQHRPHLPGRRVTLSQGRQVSAWRSVPA